jgi:hypothetical protein
MDTLFTWAALIGGTVLAFQFVMLLLGMSHHGTDLSGVHGADVSGDGHLGGVGHDSAWHHDAPADATHSATSWFYEVISIRTLSAAATFFGLAGKAALAYRYSPQSAFVMASLAGVAALYGVYWLFKQVYKLQHTGTENIRNAVGAAAVVYVPIPGKRAGAGKVTFRLQNRVVEYLAVTEDENRLATGENVVVVAIMNSDTVRVARTAASVPDAVTTA